MERLSNENLRDNYLRILENIEKAKEKAGRKDTVRLMGVTKTVPTEIINEGISLGLDLIGESKVQEFLGKEQDYKMTETHFIGGLQSNKVKYIVDKVSCIQSVDSLKLAKEISKRATTADKVMDILLQINIGDEASKGGFPKEMLDEALGEISKLPSVRIRGLMTIPPIDGDEKYFSQMNKMFVDIQSKKGDNSNSDNFLWDTLSMGMSGDYEKAIYYGSNIVRIGSLLFGYRNY